MNSSNCPVYLVISSCFISRRKVYVDIILTICTVLVTRLSNSSQLRNTKNVQFRRPCTRRSLSPSSYHGSTAAMLCWWDYQATCTAAYNRYSTLPRDPSLACSARTTSPTHSPVSTGWKRLSACSTSWQQSSMARWMARLHPTWLQTCDVCLTCRPDDVCVHLWHTSWTFVSRCVQLLATKPLLLLVLGCGTVYHQTLSHVTHYHGFVVNSKHSCFDCHTHLLCFSLLWLVACSLSWSLRFLLRPR